MPNVVQVKDVKETAHRHNRDTGHLVIRDRIKGIPHAFCKNCGTVWYGRKG